MIQQLRAKLERLEMLVKREGGPDPRALHELLTEMDIRSGGDGDLRVGYRAPGFRDLPGSVRSDV